MARASFHHVTIRAAKEKSDWSLRPTPERVLMTAPRLRSETHLLPDDSDCLKA